MNKYRDQQADRATELWLATRGISKDFAKIDPLLLLAQSKAHHLMREYWGLLTDEQIRLIKQYLKQMHSLRQRAAITNKQCYWILNLGKKIDRQQYRVNRQTKAK